MALYDEKALFQSMIGTEFDTVSKKCKYIRRRRI